MTIRPVITAWLFATIVVSIGMFSHAERQAIQDLRKERPIKCYIGNKQPGIWKMRAENARLRAAVEKLRAEVEALRKTRPTSRRRSPGRSRR